ncbi:MAG: MFS transporter [Brevibacterium sp.]|uniref:MFS transporter n=1 Tax=Brevibacterium sp. TaxID=1701 RepID=UPI00264898FD|nr:MFS transporter [Brevibacterium sp.]MDN5833532.1 MFS transporter [Brevibacterium sp.]MDN6134921.1 MFS transporter [Brevibacterium sp.]MDN6159010.1 MFS transporter [Brevibacterium sp.]MDN6176349.1 MFS transporter [Brevibacterium sp.]MDN6188669.1 MFS transporter [Brevibacterium sp.]
MVSTSHHTGAHDTSAPQPTIAGTRNGIVGVLALMVVIESLSGVVQGYLNPILPALGPVFDIDAPTINGIFLISNISFAVLTPLISRLGDSYGYRLVLRGSTMMVAIGALLMAFAPSLPTIILGVVLITGVVGFIPLMMGILRITHPGAIRTGVSYLIGTLMIMIGVGGLIAGILGALNPLHGFWIGVPFALAALICSFFLPDAGTPTHEPLALAPMSACLIGLITFVAGLSQGPDFGWTNWKTIALLVVGVVLLSLWGRLDSRSPESTRRFIDLRLLKRRSLRSVSLSTFFFGFASISYFGTNGIFLNSEVSAAGYGFGFSPMLIAVVLAAASVLSLLSSVATAPLMTRWSERNALVLAGGILAIGFAVMMLGHDSIVAYILGFGLFNLALGMYQSATRSLSVEGVPVTETAGAAGVNELALSVGIAVGAAVIKLISSATVTDSGTISSTGLTLIWSSLLVAALIAAVAGSRYPTTMNNTTKEATL